MLCEKFFVDYCRYVNREAACKSSKVGLALRSWKVRKLFPGDTSQGTVALLQCLESIHLELGQATCRTAKLCFAQFYVDLTKARDTSVQREL